MTTSVGDRARSRGADATGEELLIEADLAMYDAKEAGRDRFAVVSRDAARPDRVRARVSWLERIRGALDDDRFVLHAQPIRDLRTRRDRPARAAAADARRRRRADPAGRLPAAGRALRPDAPEIDRWVAARAIELLAADPGGTSALEVNLSGPSLNDTDAAAR